MALQFLSTPEFWNLHVVEEALKMPRVLTARWTDFLNPSTFEWTYGETPFSEFFWPTVVPVGYLVVIYTLHTIMRMCKPFEIRFIAAIHNLIMSLISAIMFIGLAYELFRVATTRPLKEGLMAVMCDPDREYTKGPFMWWCYLFYASKYYELLDTVIIVLRKKELIFLHVFHHTVVPYLFWVYMHSQQTAHWVLVLANLFVHVLMYFYYFEMIVGRRSLSPKHITMSQIVQFVIDLSTSLTFAYLEAFAGVDCAGDLYGFVLGQVIGFAFLFLFVRYFMKRYKGKGKGKGSDGSKQATSKKVD
jgi:hypothetical protein